MIKFKCKYCGYTMESPASMTGELETCPECAMTTKVPCRETPLCPYCQAAQKQRKSPQRRSVFPCNACGRMICVEPKQYLFPGPYLTEDQSACVGILEQLDHWVFTRGSRQDYETMTSQLRDKFGGEPSVRDVIWGLMQWSLKDMADNEARQLQDLVETGFDLPEARRLAMIGKNNPFRQDLAGLMKEFAQLCGHPMADGP